MGNQKQYSISVCYSYRIFRNGPVNVRLAHLMKNVLLFQATIPTVSKVNRHQSELKKSIIYM